MYELFLSFLSKILKYFGTIEMLVFFELSKNLQNYLFHSEVLRL